MSNEKTRRWKFEENWNTEESISEYDLSGDSLKAAFHANSKYIDHLEKENESLRARIEELENA